MPCWYYDKKELRDTPSHRDGIDRNTESRYRREGARFILDTGNKMGLRYDTCATGVVYFHRFYMFHSFREFHRYVTGACCLFLAGKVEETPKKCKDIIKTTRSMLTDAQMQAFGEDPKEEVMTMERILLQTIKFDLMVEHPYSYVLTYAKIIKGDKAKTEKVVQMAWTFVNDSLCTTLCLQWEAEIVAVALIYLASKLSKYDITDWEGKIPGQQKKWWDAMVDDVNLELLEDVCHQCLDLYSSASQKKEESPPPPPPPPKGGVQLVHHPGSKRPRNATPTPPGGKPVTPGQPHVKQIKSLKTISPAESPHGRIPITSAPKIPGQKAVTPGTLPPMGPSSVKSDTGSHAGSHPGSHPGNYENKYGDYKGPPPLEGGEQYTQTNPYMSSQMYSSSFMSHEGSQSIQSLIGTKAAPPPAHPPYPSSQYNQAVSQANTAMHYSQQGVYQQSSYSSQASQSQPAYQHGNYQQTSYSQPPPPPHSQYPQSQQSYTPTQSSTPSYSQPYPPPPPQPQQPPLPPSGSQVPGQYSNQGYPGQYPQNPPAHYGDNYSQGQYQGYNQRSSNARMTSRR